MVAPTCAVDTTKLPSGRSTSAARSTNASGLSRCSTASNETTVSKEPAGRASLKVPVEELDVRSRVVLVRVAERVVADVDADDAPR